MRKIIMLFLIFALLLLSGCVCEHEWVGNACGERYTCAKCGDTGPEAPGHKWTEATCQTPQTCSTCGITQGETGGHLFGNWKIVPPLSGQIEEMRRSCSVCGYKEQTEIDWGAIYPPLPFDGTKEKEETQVRYDPASGTPGNTSGLFFIIVLAAFILIPVVALVILLHSGNRYQAKPNAPAKSPVNPSVAPAPQHHITKRICGLCSCIFPEATGETVDGILVCKPCATALRAQKKDSDEPQVYTVPPEAEHMLFMKAEVPHDYDVSVCVDLRDNQPYLRTDRYHMGRGAVWSTTTYTHLTFTQLRETIGKVFPKSAHFSPPKNGYPLFNIKTISGQLSDRVCIDLGNGQPYRICQLVMAKDFSTEEVVIPLSFSDIPRLAIRSPFVSYETFRDIRDDNWRKYLDPYTLSYPDFCRSSELLLCLNPGYHPTHHCIHIGYWDNQPYEVFTKVIREPGCGNRSGLEDFDDVPTPFRKLSYHQMIDLAEEAHPGINAFFEGINEENWQNYRNVPEEYFRSR